jgi:SAM-dependent methyltransferase
VRDARDLGAYLLDGVAVRLQRAAEKIRTRGDSGPTLTGDRDIEWSWVASRLRREPGRVLDFGPGQGFLTIAAALLGHEVVAVDLEPRQFRFDHPKVRYVQGDFNQVELERDSFDQALVCSTIEHVGLAGRYGSSAKEEEADLAAMRRLATLLRPEAEVLVTLPVGRDGVFPPYHRVYGEDRLPSLLEPFDVVEQQYWAKVDSGLWSPVDRRRAVTEEGSARYYALGLLRLRVRR